MPSRYRPMVITQTGPGYCGLGELLALRVKDVDFLGRTVRVALAAREGAGTWVVSRGQGHGWQRQLVRAGSD
jgi:hypothetical protein